MQMIDLRSDTVTAPTEEMRRAMAAAQVGDDVLGEDPTVNALQERAAALLGKEAALFVSSGTMGNQLAVMAQTGPGDEIICEESAHIYRNEGGALARIAGVQTATVAGREGVLPLDAVRDSIRDQDIHHPSTALISVENTHNAHGGYPLPMDYLRDLRALADEFGLPIHMDGARLFNAAAALGVGAAQIASHCDTVTVCLSKGLCAPVGSLLCGPRAAIERARRFRKMLGGGTRQAGILAAAGLLALDAMADRLAQDHQSARALAAGIEALTGERVLYGGTNILYFDVACDSGDFVRALGAQGVRMSPAGRRSVRAVTHLGIGEAQVAAALNAVAAARKELYS